MDLLPCKGFEVLYTLHKPFKALMNHLASLICLLQLAVAAASVEVSMLCSLSCCMGASTPQTS